MDRRKFLKGLGFGGAAAVVAPTVLLDAFAPAPDPLDTIAAALDLPDGFDSPPGLNHWNYWDGGELDIGVVRDATLARTNQFTVFTESFVGITSIEFVDRRIQLLAADQTAL